MSAVETPERLSVDRQPRSEGPYRAMGPLRHPKDESCGFDVEEGFERFNQANDIYTRGQWDSRIRSEKVLNWFKGMFRTGLGARNAEGYSVRDFALRNAGWMGATLTIQRSLHQGRGDGFLDHIQPYSDPNPDRVAVESPAVMSEEIKRISRLFGADGVGITHYDPRWHYTSASRPGPCRKSPTRFPTICPTSS